MNGSLAYGMIVSAFEPHYDRNSQISLEEATDQLLGDLRQSNRKMRITRDHERIRVGGTRGLSTELSNESPLGGRETDWLVTALGPDGVLFYFIGVAPNNEFNTYYRAFDDIIATVKFR